MPEDPHNTSDISDAPEAGSPKEDSDTKTARRELKQTSISEKGSQGAGLQQSQDDKSGSDDEKMAGPKANTETPSPEPRTGDSRYDDLKEQVSSPKKKRAHEELDEQKDGPGGPADSETEGRLANSDPASSRIDRSEPEKKRARDLQGDKVIANAGADAVFTPFPSSLIRPSSTPLPSPLPPDEQESDIVKLAAPGSPAKSTPAEGSSLEQTAGKPQTTAAAFSKSGFAKLAGSSVSPFGSFGSSNQPSLFGGASSGNQSPFGVLGASKPSASKLDLSSPGGSTSPFGALGASASGGIGAAAAPKLSFGSSGSASPFASAGLNGKAFGSGGAFGGNFGSTPLAAAPLISFAGKPGQALKSDKPVRPFGAPESDAEESAEEGQESDNEGDSTREDNDEEKEKEETKIPGEEKKKFKLQKGKFPKIDSILLSLGTDAGLQLLLTMARETR